MSSAAAIDTLQSVLASTDAQLKHLFDRLERDFVRLHRTDPHNAPFPVLRRLRLLQARLPALQHNLAVAHRAKAAAAAAALADLSPVASFAAQAAAAVAAESTAPPSPSTSRTSCAAAAGALQEHRGELRAVATAVLLASATPGHPMPPPPCGADGGTTNGGSRHNQVGCENDGIDDDDDYDDGEAANRSSGDFDDRVDKRHRGARAPLQEQQVHRRQPQQHQKQGSRKPPQAAGTAATKKNSSSSSATAAVGGRRPKSVAAPSPSAALARSGGNGDDGGPGAGFQPVSKAAYNRLPRNIKVKGGKLDAVNALYEKVFATLSTSSPMSDAKLLAAVGEADTQRLDVLRGLNLISNRKDGWALL